MNHTMHDDDQQTAEGHTGHDRTAGHSVAMFRDKFWLSLILTLPVLFWSTDVQRWLVTQRPQPATETGVRFRTSRSIFLAR